MKTWVLVIFLWSDVRPIATISMISGYATFDECRLAAGMLQGPPLRMQLSTSCVYGGQRPSMF